MVQEAKPEPDKYHTLGQFYDAIKQGWLDVIPTNYFG